MRTRFPSMAVLLLACLLCVPVLLQSQSASALFEQALLKENAEGTLNEAIAIFNRIAGDKTADPAIRARAQLHVGICYEKLGDAQARSAYERLIADFPQQTSEVAAARARLARLQEVGGTLRGNAGAVLRKIDFPGAGSSPQVRLSPDGSRVLYIGRPETERRYDIQALDLASGKSWTVVEGIDANFWTHIFCWSPDGTRVVYMPKPGELRIVGSQGGPPATLWVGPEKALMFVMDWSDRSRSILISVLSGNTARLVMLPENGGEPRTVVSGDVSELEYTGDLSPDGRFVVGRKTTEKNNDIYVWAVMGGGETRVTSHPADDRYPLWSPDGKTIVFVSDRAGTWDLWAVPMAGSQPAGEPARIYANLGKNKAPTDFTPSGQLVLDAVGSVGNPPDLFVLPIDPATGGAQGAFRTFSKYPTQGSGYRWSPDGARVAYTSRKGNIQLPNAYISSGDASEDLEIPADGYWMDNVEWSRDGKSLLFPGFLSSDNRVGIFRVSLDQRTVVPVHMSGERMAAGWVGSYFGLRWLPLAGKYMFRKMVSETEQETYFMDARTYRIERAGGTSDLSFHGVSPDGRYAITFPEKEKSMILISLGDGVSRALGPLPSDGRPASSWSPDAKRLAWNDGRRLMMLTVPDGTPQTLHEAGPRQRIGGLLSGSPETAWSPDGSKIVFVLQEPASDPRKPDEVWTVGLVGGSARKIADAPATHPSISGVVWHPSGKMIVVQGEALRGRGERNEFWVMENLLPSTKEPTRAPAKK